MDGLDEVQVITEPAEKYLNQRQLLGYKSQREACLRWLLTVGEDPDRGEGYALGTVKPRASRMDMFYRWVWDEIGGYTSTLFRRGSLIQFGSSLTESRSGRRTVRNP